MPINWQGKNIPQRRHGNKVQQPVNHHPPRIVAKLVVYTGPDYTPLRPHIVSFAHVAFQSNFVRRLFAKDSPRLRLHELYYFPLDFYNPSTFGGVLLTYLWPFTVYEFMVILLFFIAIQYWWEWLFSLFRDNQRPTTDFHNNRFNWFLAASFRRVFLQ